ncbi:MAG: ADP-ribosylglycohydrolase family protein, partial [Armatimonadota bacterium]
MIPCHSRIHRAVKDALWCWENDVSWEEAREQTLHSFGHYQPCSAPQNHAFTIIGWLYGEDFGDQLCAAVNCGYDTDCSGATLGSVLGIIGGGEAIPQKWIDPISEQIVLHKFTQNLDAPESISDLTEQTIEVGRRMLAERSEQSSIAPEAAEPEDLLSRLYDNTLALAALEQDPLSTIERVDGHDLALHYNGDPVIRPGIEKLIGVSVRKDYELLEAEVTIEAPAGWRFQEAPDSPTQTRFVIEADKVEGDNFITLSATAGGETLQAEYLILGPQNAQGFPCSVNVERCPECGARVESCICP